MLIRIRLAQTPEHLFAAPALCARDFLEIPEPGSLYEDESGTYVVVKVFEAVPPDALQDISGPIMYVTREKSASRRQPVS